MPEQAQPLISGPDQETLAELQRKQRDLRPSLLEALAADVRIFSARRHERLEFDGTFRKWLNMARLMWAADEFLSVVLYRLRTAFQRSHVPVIPRLLYFLNAFLFGVRIGDHVIIGAGVHIPHGQVVIDGIVRIGKGCTLFPWSTVGLTAGSALGPSIEDRVSIGTGAKILGNITVGAGASIGANAVVLQDVPAGATAVGVPARIIERPIE